MPRSNVAFASADASKDTLGLVKAKTQITAMDKILKELGAVASINGDFYEKREFSRTEVADKLIAMANAVVSGEKDPKQEVDAARRAVTTATLSQAKLHHHVRVKASAPKLFIN